MPFTLSQIVVGSWAAVFGRWIAQNGYSRVKAQCRLDIRHIAKTDHLMLRVAGERTGYMAELPRKILMDKEKAHSGNEAPGKVDSEGDSCPSV
jgi:hypothetical protein